MDGERSLVTLVEACRHGHGVGEVHAGDGLRGRSSVPPPVARAALERLRRDERSESARPRQTTSLLALQAVLDKLNAGVFLIDATGALQFANEAGLRLLQRGDAIARSGSRLTFAVRAAAGGLACYLRLSQLAHRDGRPIPPLAVQLAPSPVAPHLFVIVSPVVVDSRTADSTVSLNFTVMVFEPRAGRFISTCVLRELYGLTQAESEVAQRLYAGRRAEQLGGDLGISLNTVRTHVRRIFEKCRVRSQAELLQLLALGPRTL